MKHLIALALFALTFTSSTAAFACKPASPCQVDSIAGEIPCVDAHIRYGCAVSLSWSCGEAAGEVTLTSDDGLSAVLNAANPETSAALGDGGWPTTTTTAQTNISWSAADQSGVLIVEYTKRAPAGCGEFDDSSCATTTQRIPAAPLTGLLPLMVGLLAWRRRRNK